MKIALRRLIRDHVRLDLSSAGVLSIAGGAALLLASAVLASTGDAETAGKPERGAAFPASTEAKPKPKPKPKPNPRLPATLKGIGIIRWGETYRHASGYERYSHVLVSRHHARAAARLPGVSLAYMSGTSVPRFWSTGVPFDEANGNGWLLKDANGVHVMNEQYGAFVADIGSSEYQQRFIRNVSSFLRSTKADGVFIDDVVANPAGLTAHRYPAKYPTGDAWEAAMVSFVSTVGSALEAQGYYVLLNAVKFVHGDTRSDTAEHTADFWRRIGRSVSGLMSEYWLQNPNNVKQSRVLGSNWYENWSGWQSLVGVAQGAGADFFGLAYGSWSDTRAMRFIRGSFLLDWDGQGGAIVYAATDRADPFHGAWVKQAGAPLGPKFERAPGVWQRRYEKAIVVVNATGAPVTVSVNGASFTIGPADALFARPPRS